MKKKYEDDDDLIRKYLRKYCLLFSAKTCNNPELVEFNSARPPAAGNILSRISLPL
jgi:hypothetical protein